MTVNKEKLALADQQAIRAIIARDVVRQRREDKRERPDDLTVWHMRRKPFTVREERGSAMKILSCPYCGGGAEFKMVYGEGEYRETVQCADHLARVEASEEGEAVAAWNGRTFMQEGGSDDDTGREKDL